MTIDLPPGVKWFQLESPRLFIRHFYAPCVEGVMGGFDPPPAPAPSSAPAGANLTGQAAVQTGLGPPSAASAPVLRFIVLGNPGIGKTSFGYYVLYRALRAGRTVVYLAGKARRTYIFSAASVLSVTKASTADLEELDDPRTVFICDSVTPPVVNAFTLLITSPRRDRWYEYSKTALVKKLIFPVFTLAEILACRRTCFSALDEAGVRERFARWGGIPRFVLEFVTDEQQADLLTAVTDCSTSKLRSSLTAESVDTNVSHRLVHLKTRGELDPSLSPRQHEYYVSAGTELASRFLARRVSDHLAMREGEQLAAFLNSEERSSLQGALFEINALRALARGGDFRVRRLTPGAGAGVDVPSTLSLPPSTKTIEFSDLGRELREAAGEFGAPATAQAAQAMLLQPDRVNYPAIDAVLPGLRLANCTVSDSHALKVAGLEKAVAAIDSVRPSAAGTPPPTVAFYWVVPAGVYPSWTRPQSYVDADGRVIVDESAYPVIKRLVQYALCMPPFGSAPIPSAAGQDAVL